MDDTIDHAHNMQRARCYDNVFLVYQQRQQLSILISANTLEYRKYSLEPTQNVQNFVRAHAILNMN